MLAVDRLTCRRTLRRWRPIRVTGHREGGTARWTVLDDNAGHGICGLNA